MSREIPYNAIISTLDRGDQVTHQVTVNREVPEIPNRGPLLEDAKYLAGNEARRYTDAERERMELYESVDSHESLTSVYKDHLQFRETEPRWFFWIFVVAIGFLAGMTSVLFVSLVHVMFALRMRLLWFGLEGFSSESQRFENFTVMNPSTSSVFEGQDSPLHGLPSRNLWGGYIMWISFSLMCSVGAAVLGYAVPNCKGVGTAEVTAHLNGVKNLSMFDKKVFVAKLAYGLLNVASGIPIGYYGLLVQCGTMIAVFVTSRSRLIKFQNINVIRHFRNPRDQRIISIIGASAGVGSAFSVAVGGLMFVLEQLSSTLATKFALYTFVSCLVSSFTVQTYYSFIVFFKTRDRSMFEYGQLLVDVFIQFNTNLPDLLPIPMNIFDIVPCVVIGVVCGFAAAAYIRIFTLATQVRRLVQLRYARAIKHVLPVVMALLYATCVYWSAAAFDSYVDLNPSKDRDSCVIVPQHVLFMRNTSVISYYGMTGTLCDMYLENGTMVNGTRTSYAPPVMHPFSSLAFGFSESTVQLLLTVRSPEMFSFQCLFLFGLIYFTFSALNMGASANGDIMVPGMVIGATIGRIVGSVTHDVLRLMLPDTQSWADAGSFAMIGAASFLGGATGLTFSICIIMIEMTNDLRHRVSVMIALSVAKLVCERFSHSFTSCYLESLCVPLLDFAGRIHKYDMFCARHIMAKDVKCMTSVMTIKSLVEILESCQHNGFPVVSVTDGTFKGLLQRSELLLVLWNVHWTRTATGQCSYDRMRQIEDRLFYDKLSGLPPLSRKLKSRNIDLSPYLDTSAYSIQEGTCLSVMYHTFRTLGMRHLVVLNRKNEIVGMITRKDLVTDRILENIDKENQRRLNEVVEDGSMNSRARAFTRMNDQKLVVDTNDLEIEDTPDVLDGKVRLYSLRYLPEPLTGSMCQSPAANPPSETFVIPKMSVRNKSKSVPPTKFVLEQPAEGSTDDESHTQAAKNPPRRRGTMTSNREVDSLPPNSSKSSSTQRVTMKTASLLSIEVKNDETAVEATKHTETISSSEMATRNQFQGDTESAVHEVLSHQPQAATDAGTDTTIEMGTQNQFEVGSALSEVREEVLPNQDDDAVVTHTDDVTESAHKAQKESGK